MAFEELARHMASRDGKKQGEAVATSGDAFLAEMAAANRRADRTRDLILGALLLVGGLGIGVLTALYALDVLDARADPQRAEMDPVGRRVSYTGFLVAVVLGMIAVGGRKLWRGLRGNARGHEDDGSLVSKIIP